MDAITQCVWGAAHANALRKKKKKLPFSPLWIGILGGILPDLDVLLKSSEDILWGTVNHRSFSHSLLFIPIGAGITWLLCFPFFRKHKDTYWIYFFMSLVAFGTHGLMDAMTSYGTQLYWPFSHTRVSWDVVSIVDPLFTIPVLLLLVYSALKKKASYAFYALLYGYCFFGAVGLLHQRAMHTYEDYLQENNISYQKLRLMPTLGSSFYFRALYESDGYFFADGVHIRPMEKGIYLNRGNSKVKKVDLKNENTFSALQKKNFEDWQWFTDDTVYRVEDGIPIYGDGRYSTEAHTFQPLWAFEVLHENPYQAQRVSGLKWGDSSSERELLPGYRYLFDASGLERFGFQ